MDLLMHFIFLLEAKNVKMNLFQFKHVWFIHILATKGEIYNWNYFCGTIRPFFTNSKASLYIKITNFVLSPFIQIKKRFVDQLLRLTAHVADYLGL